MDWHINHNHATIRRCLSAERAPDESFASYQQLLTDLYILLTDAEAVGQLLKQGCLPVPHHDLASMSIDEATCCWQLGKVG